MSFLFLADYAKTGSTAFFDGMRNLVSKGYVIPPAVGKVVEAPSLVSDGKAIDKTDLPGQYSVSNLSNGIEREKSEDVATLSNL